jgi:hypothetical protein
MKLTQDIIDRWSFAYDNAGEDAANHLGDRTEMSDLEKIGIEASIARKQIEEDAEAECVDSGLVQRALAEAGFHPAFELLGVDGEREYQALKAHLPVAAQFK